MQVPLYTASTALNLQTYQASLHDFQLCFPTPKNVCHSDVSSVGCLVPRSPLYFKFLSFWAASIFPPFSRSDVLGGVFMSNKITLNLTLYPGKRFRINTINTQTENMIVVQFDQRSVLVKIHNTLFRLTVQGAGKVPCGRWQQWPIILVNIHNEAENQNISRQSLALKSFNLSCKFLLV